MTTLPPRSLFASVMVAAALGPHGAPAQSESVVRFANGDQLSGSVQSLTPEKLIWKSDILDAPTTLRLEKVLDVTLPSEVPVFEAGHEATLTLTNGDTIRGQLASVTADSVELDTWFAGRLTFRRVMVKDLEITERPELLYRGPNGLAEWTQSADPPAWSFQSGSLRSSNLAGSAAREVELPEELSIAFDVAWRGSLRLSLLFLTDDVTTDRPENGYELAFQNRAVRLQRFGSQNQLGLTSNAAELQENEKVTIEIRASRKSGMIAFFVDGKIIEVWTDPEVDSGKFGKGIHFVVPQGAQTRISGIKVSSWDGVLEEMPNPQALRRQFRQFDQFRPGGLDTTPPEPEKPVEDGRMTLRNGDSLKGEVVSILDGFITVKTEFTEVKLPVARLRNITLKQVDLEEPKRMNGDVRAWFADGSSMVFRLDEVKEDTLKGYSQTFGTADFKVPAFSRLEFNIYSPEMEGIRVGEPW